MKNFLDCFRKFEDAVLSTSTSACAILGDIAVIYIICRLIKEGIGFGWVLFLLLITVPFLIPFNKKLVEKIKNRVKNEEKDENIF